MSEIVKELKEYAASCKACGQFTTVQKLVGAIDWIEVCEHTIRMQKIEIADLERLISNRPKPVVGKKREDVR